MEIRPRDDGDLDACAALLEVTHEADGYPKFLPGEPRTFLAPPDALGNWIAVEGDAVAGHVVLRSRSSDPVMAVATAATGLAPERLAVVARLLVAPWARRRGVGRALLETAAAAARRLGCRPVLDVERSHVAGIALYERCGWRRVGEAVATFAPGQVLEEYVYVAP